MRIHLLGAHSTARAVDHDASIVWRMRGCGIVLFIDGPSAKDGRVFATLFASYYSRDHDFLLFPAAAHYDKLTCNAYAVVGRGAIQLGRR